MTEIENPTHLSNQYAMLYGMLLGFWTLITCTTGIRSISMPILGLATNLMMIACIGFAFFFTIKCRSAHLQSSGIFNFGRAYIFCLLMCFYATIWAALGIYVYFSYFDGGAFIQSLQERLAEPENMKLLHEMEAQGVFADLYTNTGANSVNDIIKAIECVSASSYAGMMVTWSLLITPIASLIIALVTMKHTCTH